MKTTNSLVTGPRKGAKAAGSRRSMRCTAFFRTFNRDPERMNTRQVDFTAEPGTPVEELIELAHAAGASPGARSRAGVFEIQTDEGIWSTPDESKLLTMSHSGLSDRTAFKSWEAMEREERKARRA